MALNIKQPILIKELCLCMSLHILVTMFSWNREVVECCKIEVQQIIDFVTVLLLATL